MITETTIEELNQQMLDYFEKFSAVFPRGSKKEQNACKFLQQFAEEHNLEFKHQCGESDGIPVNNVVIKKNGTKGYENAKTVILQSHMDMVCQKSPTSPHDFVHEPIEIIKTDEIITANQTTLGADDGIGVACALAILASDDISHPPLEAVFTSDEEDGMSGAKNFQIDLLKGRILINIDSEDEGLFFFGCAGGVYARSRFSFQYEDAPVGCRFYKISLTGLMGGHSGIMIDQNRANANRLMGRILHALSTAQENITFCMSSIDGGTFTNAIASTGKAVIATDLDEKILFDTFKEITDAIQHEYSAVEEGMKLTIEQCESQKVLPEQVFQGIVTTLMVIPNDVIAMSSTVPGLVETSSNLGLVKKDPVEDVYELTSFIRSSVASRKALVVEQMRRLAQSVGAKFSTDTDFPEWEPNPNSHILKLFGETYEDIFQKKAQTQSVHAGLECGYFAQHYSDMDLISIGPTITGAHTPEETLYLNTTGKLIKLLTNVLERIK